MLTTLLMQTITFRKCWLQVGEIGGAVAAEDESASFFVGLTWDEVGPGLLVLL